MPEYLDMDIDLTFAQTYTVNTDAWLPSGRGSIPLYYYPGASIDGGHDGSLLEITPNDGLTWLAMFADGPQGMLSGVYGCPGGHSICVVSSGRCYFVKADDPQQWREKMETIREVKALPDHNMLILRDATSLIAYGAHGFLWKTEAISIHGLTIESVAGNVLHGRALLFNRQGDTWMGYEVNLITGKHKGGSG